MIKLSYAYFNQVDGGTLTVEQRLQAIMDLLKENEGVIFEDDRMCSNEQELRDVLKERGYIL